MLRIGEESGSLDETLSVTNDFYSEELNIKIEKLMDNSSLQGAIITLPSLVIMFLIVIILKYIKDDILTVTGDNFNYKSKIIINGKIKETNFIDENTLTTTEIPSNIKNISVGQIGKYDKILSSSNSLEIK